MIVAENLFEGEIPGEALPGAVGDQTGRCAPDHTLRVPWEHRIQALGREHGGRQEELSAGFKERRLTVRECARIQTFPRDYQFILPKNGEHSAVPAREEYKIIENTVPYIIAYNIAKNLEEKWPLYFG